MKIYSHHNKMSFWSLSDPNESYLSSKEITTSLITIKDAVEQRGGPLDVEVMERGGRTNNLVTYTLTLSGNTLTIVRPDETFLMNDTIATVQFSEKGIESLTFFTTRLNVNNETLSRREDEEMAITGAMRIVNSIVSVLPKNTSSTADSIVNLLGT